jgi:hypothetical protein
LAGRRSAHAAILTFLVSGLPLLCTQRGSVSWLLNEVEQMTERTYHGVVRGGVILLDEGTGLMPAALLDTNAVSDLMRDDPKVLAHMASYAEPVLTSVVAAGEIRFGLQRLPWGKKRRDLEALVGTKCFGDAEGLQDFKYFPGSSNRRLPN